MMVNLFSIFDPSTPYLFSSNWVILLFPILYMLVLLQTKSSYYNMMYLLLTKSIKAEFFPLLPSAPFMIIVPITTLTLIMWFNLLGLMPWVFTVTSHMSITLSLALPLWLSLMLYGWTHHTTKILIHLVPQGTPLLLAPFMTLIETISNIIRPMTLMIRLSANMVAGHLLLSLLTSTSILLPKMSLSILFPSQLLLTLLELAICFIQAYVFSVLILLYSTETSN